MILFLHLFGVKKKKRKFLDRMLPFWRQVTFWRASFFKAKSNTLASISSFSIQNASPLYLFFEQEKDKSYFWLAFQAKFNF